jgi:hypothetical protein
MRIDSGFVGPFDFAAVGARQPTSRARVLEVRIQSPPAESQQTFGSCSRAPPAPRQIELTTARDASISATDLVRRDGGERLAATGGNLSTRRPAELTLPFLS